MSHVDSTSPITHVSLCAGYGGIDLGLHRAIPSLRTIAVSEIEAFACANLVAKMEAGFLDPAPIWTDLKTFPWSDFRDRVDILSGGYPCQPFSAAGKRLGAEDPRHLWPYISAGIAAMRPGCCFFENVEGHISLGLPDVIEDLGRLGYRTTWCVASASECGAPHQRKRIWILAYDQSLGIQGRWPSWIEESRPHAGQALPVRGGDAGGEQLADSQRKGLEGSWPNTGQSDESESRNSSSSQWPSRPGEQQHAWEPPRVVADTLRKQSQRGRNAGELGSAASAEQGEAQQWKRCGNSAGNQGEAGALVDAKSQRAGQRSKLRSEECGSGSALSRDVEQSGETPQGRPLEHASDWSNGEQPTEQQGRHSVGGSGEEGAMGNAKELRRPGLRQDNAGNLDEQLAQPADTGGGQTQPPLGRNPNGPADWLDDAELHVTCDNRTDELRLLGNGVVPAVAERAWRLLVGELMEGANL